MTSLHEFLTMGRFGVFVWPAFGFGLLVMLFNIYLAHWREKSAFREVREVHRTSEENRS
ncbi:MAG: heme exporter protein CcmD [Gammaproteobacteria bacterium]